MAEKMARSALLWLVGGFIAHLANIAPEAITWWVMGASLLVLATSGTIMLLRAFRLEIRKHK